MNRNDQLTCSLLKIHLLQLLSLNEPQHRKYSFLQSPTKENKQKLAQNKLDQFVNILERIDEDSPLTIKTIRDIKDGAAQGTPYIFANLQETIEQLQQARVASNQALEQLFDNTLTDVQRATANRIFDKESEKANDLQELLGRIMSGEIE